MPSYELVFIISPEVTDDEIPGTITKVTDIIGKVGGNVTEISQWGRRRLAYPIKRHAEASYVLAELELEPTSTRKLEAELRVSGEVLRHLLVRSRE